MSTKYRRCIILKTIVSFVIVLMFLSSSVLAGLLLNEDRSENQDQIISNNDDWPLKGHDPQRTSYTPHPGPQTNNVKWTYQTNASIRSSPIIIDDHLFCGSSDYALYCLNAETGEKIWHYTTEGKIWSTPYVSNGSVVIGSLDDTIYCLDFFTGALKWKNEEYDAYFGDVIVGLNDEIYAIAKDELKCFDLNNGNIKWIHNYDSKNPNDITVYNGVIYLSCHNGILYSIDSQTGKENWNLTTNEPIVSAAVLNNADLFIGGTDGYLYCLNKSTGSLKWKILLSNQAIWNTVSRSSDYVYVCTLCGLFYCLDADDGEVQWVNTIGGYSGGSTPVIADDKVYVGGEFTKKIYCYDAISGEELWRYQNGHRDGYFFAELSVAHTNLYIGSDDGRIYCFGSPNTIKINSIKETIGRIQIQFKNVGNSTLENIPWMINYSGNLLFGKTQKTGTIHALQPDETQTITSGFILGFGYLEVDIIIGGVTTGKIGTLNLLFPQF